MFYSNFLKTYALILVQANARQFFSRMQDQVRCGLDSVPRCMAQIKLCGLQSEIQ